MIHDLDNVLLSPRIEATWLTMLTTMSSELMEKYPDLTLGEVPDEQLRVLPSGNAELFIQVRESELKLAVPRDEYAIV